jgi:SAM-dependent methyltransferase
LAQNNSPTSYTPSPLPFNTDILPLSWDDLYTNEISNHSADPSDIGTVWFDDSDAEAKILEFLDGLLDPSDPDSPREKSTFLDLGCGNGSLLFSLRGEEWSARALGVDYSPQSIALARQITATKDDLEEPVEFEEWDLIAGSYDPVLNGEQAQGWDVVLDKGTFDAISLSDEKDAQGRRLCECYRERVLPLVRKGGIFLVTSCNWTETELKGWFEKTDAEGFDVVGRVEYRSFSFGGHKGQTISTLCFRRV